jgi:hypothetical protein
VHKRHCWSVGTIYNTSKLSGVNNTGPGLDEVLQLVSEPILVVSHACAG